MHAHPAPIHLPVDYTDNSLPLLDEEFDAFDIRPPFNRPDRPATLKLQCDGRCWEDDDDNFDIAPL